MDREHLCRDVESSSPAWGRNLCCRGLRVGGVRRGWIVRVGRGQVNVFVTSRRQTSLSTGPSETHGLFGRLVVRVRTEVDVEF